MKNIILSALLIIAIVGCKKKKKYNCRCTTTVIYKYVQSSYISKNEKMSQKMTEKQATAVCANEAKNVNATYVNYITNNGNWSSNGLTASTICALE